MNITKLIEYYIMYEVGKELIKKIQQAKVQKIVIRRIFFKNRGNYYLYK